MTSVAPFRADERANSRTSSRIRSRAQVDAIAVYLPPVEFACAWIAVVVVRLVCVAFLIVLSLLNSALAVPEMEYYAQLITPKPQSLFSIAAWTANVLLLGHTYQLANMVVLSIKARELTFCRRWQSKKDKTATMTTSRTMKALTRFKRMLARLFHWKRIFHIDSLHFEEVFLAREFAEMVSQTVQVHSSSTLIAREWINHYFVGVVLVNSFSTPLVHHVFKHPIALQRLLCVVVDIVLDMATCIGLPLIVVFPYFQHFDMAAFTMDVTILYDISQFVNLVMETRQIFARSMFDLVMKTLPHLSIYSCLGSVQWLLRPQRGAATPSQPPHAVFRSRKLQHPLHEESSYGPALHGIAPAVQDLSKASHASSIQQKLILRSSHLHHNVALVHNVFVAWGFCIAVLHLLATFLTNYGHVAGCKLLYHPWFSTSYTCSVYEYNCYRQGTTSPSEDFLAFLDKKALTALVISHCPDLVVPTAIQQFHSLFGFEIWNSSLVSWSKASALTQAAHPLLTYVSLVGVNMTTIPEGLLQELPYNLDDIEITHSNLSSLPDNLDSQWADVGVIFIEHTALTEFPAVLTRMKISDLSLVGNSITTLPDITSSECGFFKLSLSNTPLTKLPESIGTLSNLQLVALENTQLQELPAWIYQIERQAFKIFLAGTPFCASKSAQEIATRYGPEAVITCADTNLQIDGRYPYEDMRASQEP